MLCMSTKFCVNSSSHFPFRVQTPRQTHRVADIADYSTHDSFSASMGINDDSDNIHCHKHKVSFTRTSLACNAVHGRDGQNEGHHTLAFIRIRLLSQRSAVFSWWSHDWSWSRVSPHWLSARLCQAFIQRISLREKLRPRR